MAWRPSWLTATDDQKVPEGWKFIQDGTCVCGTTIAWGVHPRSKPTDDDQVAAFEGLGRFHDRACTSREAHTMQGFMISAQWNELANKNRR